LVDSGRSVTLPPAACTRFCQRPKRRRVIPLAGNKKVFAEPPRIADCAIAVVLGIAFAAGCDREAAPAPKPITPVAAIRLKDDIDAAAAAMQFRGEVVDGYLIVYVVDVHGQNGVAVRRTRVNGVAPDAASIAANERIAARRWLAAGSRDAALQSSDALQEHDAWIETVQRLQDGLRDDPTHLGMMRDLLTAEIELLSFEAGSPLGPRVCKMTSTAATQFESAAGPVDPADRQLIARARQHVFFSMKLYPCLSAATGELAIWKTLGAPTDFVLLDTFAVGRFTVTEQRVVEPCPKGMMLWDELFFVISSGTNELPENTTAYVLGRRGQGQEARYYLFFRSIRGEQLVSVFGQESPELPSLRSIVERSIAAAETQFAGGRP